MNPLWFSSRADQAISSAYAAFIRQHPEWVAALFDQHFLDKRMRLLISGDLTLPDGASLALWWADHIGLSGASRTRWVALLTPAAGQFLELLRLELASKQPARGLATSAW